jgi:branched-chain amino acid transport system permease protein
VLGGLDSPIGAVVGGVVLGIVLNLVGAYIDFFADLRLPAALLLILGILLLRPNGLFGRSVVRRV